MKINLTKKLNLLHKLKWLPPRFKQTQNIYLRRHQLKISNVIFTHQRRQNIDDGKK